MKEFRKRVFLFMFFMLPSVCLADPFNGGFSDGIEEFLYKVFGTFLPSVAFVVLFFKQFKANNFGFSFLIYPLCIYLFAYCYLKLTRYIYLIDLQSHNTYLNGYYPDFSEEKTVIVLSAIGMLLIASICVILLLKMCAYLKFLNPSFTL